MSAATRCWPLPLLTLLACQSPQAQGTTSSPVPPDVASSSSSSQATTAMTTAPPSSPPGKTSSIDLTYDKRCSGWQQPRSLSLSSASGRLGLSDEAGEARLAQLAPDRIAAFAAALRKAGIERITSSPRKGGAPPACTITLHVVLDGAAKDIEESAASEVNDPAAWKDVVTLMDELWSGKR
jgi:hypothetical protein